MALKARPFIKLRTEQLKELAVTKPDLIAKIVEELKHRHRPSAVELLGELTAGQNRGLRTLQEDCPRVDMAVPRLPVSGFEEVIDPPALVQQRGTAAPKSQPKLFPEMESRQEKLFSVDPHEDADSASTVANAVVPPPRGDPQGEPMTQQILTAAAKDEPRKDLLGSPLPHVLPANIPPIKSAEQIGGDEPTVNPGADTVVDRTLRLFRFLVDLENLRQDPVRDFGRHPWRLPLSEVPLHAKVRVGTVPGVADEGIILEVENPERYPRPKPPASISGWLSSQLDDPRHPPEVSEELPGRPPQRFRDDPQRPVAWDSFRVQWNVWADKELADKPIRDIYQQLIALRDLLAGNTDTLQLMVADGLLAWDSPAGSIRHPLLGRRVDISFDMARQIVRVTDSGEATVPLFNCLRDSRIGAEKLKASLLEIRENNRFPPSDMALAQLLAIRERWFSRASKGRPTITRYPLLLLISSHQKAGLFLQEVISDIQKKARGSIEEARSVIPPALQKVVGNATATPLAGDDGNFSIRAIDPEDPSQQIFFTKPANHEQAAIVAQTRRHPCAVVLGPPGTGKTHTIANLIGHFLAEGKSVLVTSQTAKALGEVKRQVVPQLQDLCISLLSTDIESRNEVQGTGNGIIARLGLESREDLEKQAEAHLTRIVQAGNELLELRSAVRKARESEIEQIVIAGQSWNPIDAAKYVATHRDGNDWIPPGVTAGISCPLSEEETLDLYRLNAHVTPDVERELEGKLPSPDDLPSVAELENMLVEESRLAEAAEASRDGWIREFGANDREKLSQIVHMTDLLLGQVGRTGWELTVMAAGAAGGPAKASWQRLLTAWADLIDAEKSFRGLLDNCRIEKRCQDSLADLHAARAIEQHIRDGGSLGSVALLLHPTWKDLCSRWKVDGSKPTRLKDFGAIVAHLEINAKTVKFRRAWEGSMTDHGGDPPGNLGTQPAVTAQAPVGRVEELLRWHCDSWLPLSEMIKDSGIDWQTLQARRPAAVGPRAVLEGLLATLTDEVLPRIYRRLALADLQSLRQRMIESRSLIAAYAVAHPRSVVLNYLLSAWDGRKCHEYNDGAVRLDELSHRRVDYRRREELLGKLAPVASVWAAAIKSHKPPHSGLKPPGGVRAAWVWRQLTDELDRRATLDLPATMVKIERKGKELREGTAEYARTVAWAGQHLRSAGQPLVDFNLWLQMLQAVGAGFGKKVPELLAEASRLLKTAREVVPVWIMPLDRVFESVSAASRRFDVLIVDEASQLGPEGVGLFYLADRVIIVGDDQQVTPTAIQEIDKVTALQNLYLGGIPGATLFDSKRSLYSIATAMFGTAQVSLSEHFRCVPDIICFSNQLCYIPINQKILPLREASDGKVFPSVVSHTVCGVRKGKVNEAEAVRVASLFGAMIERAEYRERTFGIISMLGIEQSSRIEEIVRNRLSLDENRYEKLKGGGGLARRLCGEPPNFQGDERDVILISIVDSPTGGGPLPMKQATLYRQRFNVAASRPRDQMWVVSSLNPYADLQPMDLRRRLIEHARDPKALLEATATVGARTESPFEREVAAILIAAGYKVTAQYPAGAYRIDLVVGDGKHGLAVECDGERYHQPGKKLEEDIDRQTVLERHGWRFVRIRGSAFYRDRMRAMQPVYERLKELGIDPVGPRPGLATTPAHELVEAIVRRAEELEREWRERDEEEMAQRSREDRRA